MLKFFPRTTEPFGRYLRVGIRLSVSDEYRVERLLADIHPPKITKRHFPQLDLVRAMGTSRIDFIRETLSNIVRTQSGFEIGLSRPFLVDRGSDYTLHVLAYAPELKILRTNVRNALKDIHLTHWDNTQRKGTKLDVTVGNYSWPPDTKLLLKSRIPHAEGDLWKDHADRQCSKRLNPVTAIGLTLTRFEKSHRVIEEYDGPFVSGPFVYRIPMAETLDSDIVHEEYPFLGNHPIKPFDINRRV